MLPLLLLTAAGIIKVGIGADILVATMLQGKSHIGSMLPLLKELVRQGKN